MNTIAIRGLSVTVYFGSRKGSASTSDTGSVSVDEAVAKACSLARYGAADEAAGLADASRMATEFPDLQLYHPWSLKAEDAIELARECESAALGFDGRISNSEGATVGTQEGCRVYGNSHGFLAGYPDSHHSLSCAVLAADGSEMQRDYEFTVARDPGDLAGAGSVGRGAAQRTVDRLGARKLDTRTTPVIYPARLARGLIGHAIGALRGGALCTARPAFCSIVWASRYFPTHLSVHESPLIAKGLSSCCVRRRGCRDT